MANCVEINSNKEWIYDDEDIIYIIKKYLGNDFGKIVEKVLNGVVEEITPEIREKVLEQTDYYAYEDDLDSNRVAFCDIRDIADELAIYLDNKRISRSFIAQKINKISKIAIEQI